MVVATVHIAESTGVTPTITDNITNLNLVSIDAANSSSSANPVTASEYSFQKWIRYELHAKNDSNTIDNFKVWMTPAATTTGITYVTNLQNPLVNTTFDQPTATYEPGTTDQTMPDTSAPASENIGVAAGSGGLSTDSTYSDYMVIQLGSTGSTPPGNLPQKTFHFQYDEQ